MFVHAIASPYRDRSHFDGQNVLETGGTQPYAVRDGWLNRLDRHASALKREGDRDRSYGADRLARIRTSCLLCPFRTASRLPTIL